MDDPTAQQDAPRTLPQRVLDFFRRASPPAQPPATVAPEPEAMDVRLYASAEDRLHLIERARAGWTQRPPADLALLARWQAARRRQGARALGDESALVVGGSVPLLEELRRLGGIQGVDVLDLSEPHREAAQAVSDGDRFPVRAHAFSWLLRAMATERFDAVLLEREALRRTAPPLLAELLRIVSRMLAPGGTLYAELPTWQDGYAYRVSRDLRHERPEVVEHVLPTREFFRLLAAERILVTEVRDLDARVGHLVQGCLGVKERAVARRKV